MDRPPEQGPKIPNPAIESIRPRTERNHYEVVNVRGGGREVFWVVWTDVRLPNDLALRITGNLTESELRTYLANEKYTEAEINSRIQQARENPG